MTQKEALAIMYNGNSVLLTGAAGTGKTYTLQKFIQYAKSQGKTVAITATTGIAATHLGGSTIHSWSGIGVNDELSDSQIKSFLKSRQETINKTDVLIIDEISMLHDFRLDLVNKVCMIIKNSKKPFGGIQVILSGDFFQLPPVNRSGSKHGSFITKSNIWSKQHFTVCYLDQQYRQKDDKEYEKILNGIRKGQLSLKQIHNLRSTNMKVFTPFNAVTKLLTTNLDVDEINKKELDKIDKDSVFYSMKTQGSKKYVDQLVKSCLAPQNLELKIGANVMCIKNNLEKKYVNGSLGIVTGFDKENQYPIVRLNTNKTILIKPEIWELSESDKVKASAWQIPLRLAWAITIHKSQGMTLDSAEINLGNSFVEGMGYVALSRVKNLSSLKLESFNKLSLMVSIDAKNLDTELRQKSEKACSLHSKTFTKYFDIIEKDNMPKKILSKTPWTDKLSKMRQQYPNAYKPWKNSDDNKLVKLFSQGKDIKSLSSTLGRHPRSIKLRLEKHFGDDIFA